MNLNQNEIAIDNTIESNSKKRGRPRSSKIPDHIKKSADTDSYFCSVCKKTFKSRTQQYYHYSCGNDVEKIYKCKNCERVFSSRSHLNYHLETHSSKVYNCLKCNKAFKNKLVLKKHEKTHTNNNLFKCAKCGKIFHDKVSLRTHCKEHNNGLNYQCDLCENHYTSKSTLTQHKLKHLAKKHKCSQCGKHFQRKSILKLHMKRHSKTDSLTCLICFKTFFEADSLRRHSQIHNDAKKYKCMICDIVSLRKDNMQRHLRNIHSVENSTSCIEIINPEDNSIKCIENPNKNCDEPNDLCKDDDKMNLPKTVENSSVIKCIGNVKPVKVPNDAQKKKLFAKRELIKTEKCDGMNSITHKKFKKKYDPIEMYKKILIPDNEVEVENKLNDNKNGSTEKIHLIAKTGVEQHRSTLNISNFSEMHWRKNFKYTYEYQDY